MKTKTSKRMKWSVALMLFPMVMFLPSIMNFFIPDAFVDLYLHHDAGQSIADLQKIQPEIASILLLGFQGMGFTIIGYHLLAWPLILFPYRNGEPWAIITLVVAQLFIWIVNTVLEYQHNGTFLMVAYSIIAIISILTSAILWKKKQLTQSMN